MKCTELSDGAQTKKPTNKYEAIMRTKVVRLGFVMAASKTKPDCLGVQNQNLWGTSGVIKAQKSLKQWKVTRTRTTYERTPLSMRSTCVLEYNCKTAQFLSCSYFYLMGIAPLQRGYEWFQDMLDSFKHLPLKTCITISMVVNTKVSELKDAVLGNKNRQGWHQWRAILFVQWLRRYLAHACTMKRHERAFKRNILAL